MPVPPADDSMMTGGALVVGTLKKAGVEALFALHGAHIDTIFQACLAQGIRLIDMRHEAAVGHAAEGYARTTRALGVAVVTAGPGFTNCVSSIANAWTDRTPVLYISGAPELGQAETNTLQDGVAQVDIAKPITKFAHQINRTADIPRLVAHAIRVATTPPMGPVFLNIPSDIAVGLVPESQVVIPGDFVSASPAYPDPALVAKARDLLAGAARPVIHVGPDALYAGADAVLKAFAEATGIPVFSDFAGHGLIPASHPLYGGTQHKLAYIDDKPDVVLALGSKFGLFTMGRGDMLFGDAKLIHVTTNGAEIGRVRPAEIGIVADPTAFLTVLQDDLPVLDRPKVDAWAKTVADAIPARRAHLDTRAEGHNGPIHPWKAVEAIGAAVREHVLVADGAECYHWFNEALAQEHPASYLTHGHLGCMGIGLGLSIGAQVATDVAGSGRRVILLVGDGAVGFNIAEFDTMVRQKLPIVVVVMNNNSWGASQHFQELAPDRAVIGTALLGGARYDKVAQGFGCDGAFVERVEDIAPAIKAALASGRPTCIEVRVSFDPKPPELDLMGGKRT